MLKRKTLKLKEIDVGNLVLLHYEPSSPDSVQSKELIYEVIGYYEGYKDSGFVLSSANCPADKKKYNIKPIKIKPGEASFGKSHFVYLSFS